MASNTWKSKGYSSFIATSNKMLCCITQVSLVTAILLDNNDANTDLFLMCLAPSLAEELAIDAKAFEMKYGRSQWSMVAETCLYAHIHGFFDLRWFHTSGLMPKVLEHELYILMNISKDQW